MVLKNHGTLLPFIEIKKEAIPTSNINIDLALEDHHCILQPFP